MLECQPLTDRAVISVVTSPVPGWTWRMHLGTPACTLPSLLGQRGDWFLPRVRKIRLTQGELLHSIVSVSSLEVIKGGWVGGWMTRFRKETAAMGGHLATVSWALACEIL